MTVTLYAQPYDMEAQGFYFSDAESYYEQAGSLTNRYGDLAEEFEIQFIDGGALDCALAEAASLSQGNFAAFFEATEKWEDYQKVHFIIANQELGYSYDIQGFDPDDLEIDLYGVDSLTELAAQFIDEGLYGDIPHALRFYIDYDAIARDLAIDYSETTIAGERYIYRHV